MRRIVSYRRWSIFKTLVSPAGGQCRHRLTPPPPIRLPPGDGQMMSSELKEALRRVSGSTRASRWQWQRAPGITVQPQHKFQSTIGATMERLRKVGGVAAVCGFVVVSVFLGISPEWQLAQTSLAGPSPAVHGACSDFRLRGAYVFSAAAFR